MGSLSFSDTHGLVLAASHRFCGFHIFVDARATVPARRLIQATSLQPGFRCPEGKNRQWLVVEFLPDSTEVVFVSLFTCLASDRAISFRLLAASRLLQL